MADSQPTLSVEDLKTYFFTKGGVARAVDGVSFSINRGEVMGLVGESGSGKSVTGFSIMGLVDPPGEVVSGRILFQGEDLVGADDERMRELRGSRVAMIFQDPMMTLNPVLRIDTQMIEAVQAHEKVDRRTAFERSRDALGQVGIPSPEERLSAYPHQFSGGMRQRVAIAIALLHQPELIIADEPTTALDVTIQGQILFEVQKLCRERGMSLIWITHDLAVVAGLADKICVMYSGRIVETGAIDDVLDGPLHPYTKGSSGRCRVITSGVSCWRKFPVWRRRCSMSRAVAPFIPGARAPMKRAGGRPELSAPVQPGHQVRCIHPHLEPA